MRKILIVDDSEINRTMLKKMLCDEYDILETPDGREALEILNNVYEQISAVLLGIAMPGTDGCEVLTYMRCNMNLAQIPVIVTADSTEARFEIKALSLGANDYIIKPYNPDIIKRRLWNTINMCETASIANVSRRDELTGIYNRRGFFDLAADMIAAKPAGYYVMACFDVDNFKVINDQFGNEKGDSILRYIADIFSHSFGEAGGICCRIMADDFAVLYPRTFMDSPEIADIYRNMKVLDGSVPPITFSIGRYIVEDLSLPVSAMYDRALIAEASIKGRYDVHIAMYHESMRDRLLREQEITSEMNIALEHKNFEVWFQPQYNHSTGALIGAEALVRWRHPKYGLIYPDEFVPVFERNGFIYELDKYVWERSCILLRKWLDEGRSPLAVSVNISRYDVFREDFMEVLTGLVKKYDIPIDLLRLEITESAFAKSTDQIINIVKQLVDRGFTLEIDDFGSGYSSLNTLKDVPANVLKLDMRFLENDTNPQRGGNILESVVRMAKWLGMSVIAEGVETVEQANFLQAIGCNYIQGYLYSEPITAEAYEALENGAVKEKRMSNIESVENLDKQCLNMYFADVSEQIKLEDSRKKLLENLPCGAGIYILNNGTCSAVYLNGRYRELFGSRANDVAKCDVLKIVHPDDRKPLMDELYAAAEERRDAEYTIRVMRDDGECLSLRISGNTEKQPDGSILVYATYSLISREEASYHEMIPVVMDTIMRTANDLSFVKDRNLKYVCCSRAFARMIGLERKDIIGKTDFDIFDKAFAEKYRADDLNIIENNDSIFERVERIPSDDKSAHFSSTSKYLLHDSSGSVIGLYGVGHDITEFRKDYSRLKLITESMPGGIVTYAVSAGKIRVLYFNDNFCKLLGYTREEYEKISSQSAVGLIYEQDMHIVNEQLNELLTSDTPISCTYRVHTKNSDCKWINLRAVLAEKRGDIVIINAAMYDVTEQAETQERLRISEEEIKLALSRMGKMVLLYDIPTRTLTIPDAYAQKHGMPNVSQNVPHSIADRNMIYGKDRDNLLDFYDAILRGEKSGVAQLRIRCTDNSWPWERAEFVTIFDSNGKPAKAVISVEDTTAQHEKEKANEETRHNERVLQLVASHSGRLIYRYDIASGTARSDKFTSADSSYVDMSGKLPEALIDKSLVLPESVDDCRGVFAEINSGKPEGSVKLHLLDISGNPRWFDVQYSLIFNSNAVPKLAVISLLDITENHKKELAYERYRLMVDSSITSERLLYFDTDLTANKVEKVGGNIPNMTFPPVGCRHEDAVCYGIDNLLTEKLRAKARVFFSREHLITAFSDGIYSLSEEWCTDILSGKICWYRSDIQLVQDSYSNHIRAFTSLIDITDEKAGELDLLKQAETDGMTGLYNKTTAEAQIKRALSDIAGKPCALLIADLDNLKAINDTRGHDLGDKAIRTIADSLHEHFRKTDIVGRIGGDEFIVFFEYDGSEEGLSSIMASFMRRLSYVHIDNESSLALRSSIGVALGSSGADSYETLFKKADRALYHVKRSGKDNYAIYTPEMDESSYSYTGSEDAITWRPDSIENEEFDRLLDAISTMYPLVISVNLTKNSYYIMKYSDSVTKAVRDSGAFDDLISFSAETFAPEDRESFLKAFSRGSLLEAYNRGDRMVSHVGRQLCDGGVYRLISTHVIFVESEGSDDVTEITFSREVFMK